MLQLRLNAKLDPAPFARTYAEKRCVQIPDFFDAESAAALEAVISSLPWRLLMQDEATKNLVLTREQMTALAPERRRALEEGMKRRAADGVGHLYLVYPMIEAALEGYDPGHPIHALTEFLNSRPMIEFARELIRLPAVSKLDAHASCYLPGHYLNRHIRSASRASGSPTGAACCWSMTSTTMCAPACARASMRSPCSTG